MEHLKELCNSPLEHDQCSRLGHRAMAWVTCLKNTDIIMYTCLHFFCYFLCLFIYAKCFKTLNTSCLQKNLDKQHKPISDCFWRSSLIMVFPVCCSVKHFVNYSTDTKFYLLTEKCSRLYSKTCVKWPLSKRQKIGFQDQLLLNAGQKYCRMLGREHSAILSTFIKLPVVIKTFILSICEWLFYI